MRRFYPFLNRLTVFVAVGGGIVGTFVFEWFKEGHFPEGKRGSWDWLITHWTWLAFSLGLLLALTLIAYIDDRRHKASDSDPRGSTNTNVTNSTNTAINSPGARQQKIDAGHDAITAEKVEIHNYGTTTAAPPSTTGVPRQLPRPPDDFVGRTDEINALVAAVRQGGATISALRGMGGIGKTALALKVAEILTPDFPGGQIYLDLKGASHDAKNPSIAPFTPGDAMDRVIRSHNARAPVFPDDDARTAEYRHILAGKRTLLLMDNARDADQVKPLIPPAGPVMIVTSRARFTLPGFISRDLDRLPPEGACKLLTAICDPIEPYAAEFAKLCDYLPEALRGTASTLRERPNLTPADLLQRMRDTAQKLEITGVTLSLTTSLNLLAESGAELRDRWLQLGVFPGTFADPAAAALWQIEPAAAQDALGDLLRYNLIEFDQNSRRYRLHDLVRDFTTTSHLDEAARDAAQFRHANHYKDVLATAQQSYLRGGDGVLGGLALFDLEWTNIRAGQTWAAACADQNDRAAVLAAGYPAAGAYLLLLRQQPREQIEWLEIAIESARRLRDRAAEGFALGNLGIVHRNLSDDRRAIALFEKSLSIAHEIHDRDAEGAWLEALGASHRNLGDYRRALEYNERALAIFRELGNRHGEGAALGNLGIIHSSLGDYQRAIESYQLRLTIARELGDRRGQATALGSLGIANKELGNHDRAVDLHNQHLEIARELGDRLGQSDALGNLGVIWGALGQHRRAIEFCEQQLAMAREIHYLRGEANALFSSAWSFFALGQLAEAIRRAEQALTLYEQIRSPNAEVVRNQLIEWRKAS
jgi:tetratricopeptide (TPR) repeat protein